MGRERRERWPESAEKSDFRSNVKRYGLDPDELWEKYKDHDGLCDICDKPARGDKTGRRLSVDHDHATGKFRGFICHNCNVALGLVHDDKDVLVRMIEYLDNDGTVSAYG
jgi:hypothetical protein